MWARVGKAVGVCACEFGGCEHVAIRNSPSVELISHFISEGWMCSAYVQCAFGPSLDVICILSMVVTNFKVSRMPSLSASRYDVESASLPSLFLRM